MQKQGQKYADTKGKGDQDMATKISHKDEVKLLKKKITILKQAVFAERLKNNNLQNELHNGTQKLKKYEGENKKKQQKNQTLLIEIRSLKDALITERNEKQVYIDLLRKKQEEQKNRQVNGGNKMSANNYFGLKGLFQK